MSVVAEDIVLGIDGGGTKTVALYVSKSRGALARKEAGPGNVRLLTDRQLIGLLKDLSIPGMKPTRIVVGLAGARTANDRQRVVQAARKVWRGIECLATNDLENAIAAPPGKILKPRILVVSGTGSAFLAKGVDGKTVKFGGWGHLLGDKGSGYEIGLRALKAVVYYYDRDASISKLTARLLRALQLTEPNDFITWAQQASKQEIAALAPEVFKAWEEKDEVADDILKGAAHSLAKDALSCARKLGLTGKEEIEVIFSGGVLQKNKRFASRVKKQIQNHLPQATIIKLDWEPAWGAVRLANAGAVISKAEIKTIPTKNKELENFFKQSPTEKRHPSSMNLHRLPIRNAVALMLHEDKRIPTVLLTQSQKIETAVKWISQSFRKNGRLFYVGAGTSGRLGVLDASECPPTFRTDPEMVQGIIAGGPSALWKAVEGAEDDRNAGEMAVKSRRITSRDVVVGIAASGRTPFVWGALAAAKKAMAKTILITFNPSLQVSKKDKPSLIIDPNLGPEILTGSTRLKAGTATKLLLNIFTTLSMVQIGKVRSNLMVDVHPTNEKLKVRAIRMVVELTGCPQEKAQKALESNDWNVSRAVDSF